MGYDGVQQELRTEAVDGSEFGAPSCRFEDVEDDCRSFEDDD